MIRGIKAESVASGFQVLLSFLPQNLSPSLSDWFSIKENMSFI